MYVVLAIFSDALCSTGHFTVSIWPKWLLSISKYILEGSDTGVPLSLWFTNVCCSCYNFGRFVQYRSFYKSFYRIYLAQVVIIHSSKYMLSIRYHYLLSDNKQQQAVQVKVDVHDVFTRTTTIKKHSFIQS